MACVVTTLAVTVNLLQRAEGMLTMTEGDDRIPSTADERKNHHILLMATYILSILPHTVLHDNNPLTDRTCNDEIRQRICQDPHLNVNTRLSGLPCNAENHPLPHRDQISSGNNHQSDRRSKDKILPFVLPHNAINHPPPLQFVPPPLQSNHHEPTPRPHLAKSKRCVTGSTPNMLLYYIDSSEALPLTRTTETKSIDD